MTATLDREAMEQFSAFSYEPVDVSLIPSRAPRGPGRQRQPNPHQGVMAQIAGTESAIRFTLVHPERFDWPEPDIKRLVSRQRRLLWEAAQVNERSVKVWFEVEGPELRIYAQDRPYVKKPRKGSTVPEDVAQNATPVQFSEGSPE